MFLQAKLTRLSKPERFSFLFIAATLALVGMAHLGPMLIAVLFSYLALSKLHIRRSWNKWAAVGLFAILVAAVSYGLGHFTSQTVRALPDIADKAIPSFIEYARKQGIEPGFTDFDSLRDAAVESARGQARYLGSFVRFARGASTELLLLVIGVIVAVSLFLRPAFSHSTEIFKGPPNLFSTYTPEIARRFENFYRSFARVLGAQVIISGINTVLTTIFILSVGLPYPLVVVGITFFCGLVPVIGNLISNTIIVGVGFTVSPRMALSALIFLVVIHKLEYFLNSQIIGHRIRNPVWLTLIALVVGERLMGVPGVILAPVVLHYLKEESSAIEVACVPEPTPSVAIKPAGSQEAPCGRPPSSV